MDGFQATGGERMRAAALDVLIVGGPVAGGAYAIASLAGERHRALVLFGSAALLAMAALTILTATWATTPGKRVVGLAIRRSDGSRPGLVAALRRELLGRLAIEHGLALAGGAGLIGYVGAFTGRGGLAWHDRIADTIVLSTSARPVRPTLAPPFAITERVAPDGATYASCWERVGAALIDVGFAFTVWATIVTPIGIASGAVRSGSNHLPGWYTALLLLLAPALWTLYTSIAIWWRETTIGKHAVGLVVRRVDGSRCGGRKAVLRELIGRCLLAGVGSSFSFGIVALVDAAMAIWDGKRQSLHDKVASTIVVHDTPRRRPRTAAQPVAVAGTDTAPAA